MKCLLRICMACPSRYKLQLLKEMYVMLSIIVLYHTLFHQMPAIPAAVEGYLSELIEQCWNMDPDVLLIVL